MIIQMGDDAEAEADEIESPGTLRHKMLLAEKGLVPSFDLEEEEEEDGDNDEVGDVDDEMTEDEFEEEDLED